MLGVLGLLLALLLALASLYFGMMNQTPVSVTLLPGMPPRSAYIAEIALYAALAGALFSASSLLWVYAGVQGRCRRLSRRVRELERQLKQAGALVGEVPVTALEPGVVEPAIPAPQPVPARVDEEPV